MKFTPNENFKHGAVTFEAGNTYDSDIQELSQEDLKIFHGAGWAEVEGWDKAPAREPGAVTLDVVKARHAKAAGLPQVSSEVSNG